MQSHLKSWETLEEQKMAALLGFAAAFFGLLTVLVAAFYSWSFGHWKRKKLPYLEPKFPFGCIPKEKKRFGDVAVDWYKEIKSRRLKHAGKST